METIAIITVEKLVIGDVFGFMTPNSSKIGAFEVVEHKNEFFGDSCTMAIKSLKDGIVRQANWHKGNQVGLVSTKTEQRKPTLEELTGGKSVSDYLAATI